MFQMTLTQIPNSIISSNYFWGSTRVTSVVLTKETSAKVSLYLQPITNCYDFSLWLQFPVLISLLSQVPDRSYLLAYCLFSSGYSQYYCCSKVSSPQATAVSVAVEMRKEHDASV